MGDEIKRVHNTAFDKYVTKQLEDPEFARGYLQEVAALERLRQMQNAAMRAPEIDRALLANCQSSIDRNAAAVADDIERGVMAGLLTYALEPWWRALWRRM